MPEIEGRVYGFQFVDSETKQFVMVIPSLAMSGYGSTVKQAEEMIEHSLKHFISSLTNASSKEVEFEMRRLGWVQEKFHTKVMHPISDSKLKLTQDSVEEFNQIEIPLAA